jgi:hypothetical protein
MKNSESLMTLMENEQKRLASLKEKRAAIDEKIRKSEGIIQKYTLMQNSAKFSSFTDILQGTGLAFDEILSAIKSGDLLSLQEKLEAKTEDKGNNSDNGASDEASDNKETGESDGQ